MRRFLIICCLLTAVSLFSTGNGDADEKKILVLPFHVASDVEGYEPLGEGLADMFIADLSAFPDVTLVGREHLEKILQEEQISLAGLTNKNTQLKIGGILHADLVLSGTFALVDSKIKVTAHLFDVATTRLTHSREAEGDISEWLNLEKKIARMLVNDLSLTVSKEQEFAIDEKPEISLHFIRGLGYYYGCKYDHAIMEFQHILYGDEKYVDARYWMARSYQALKEHDHARIEFKRIVREFPNHRLAKVAEKWLKE